ncbi:hypothetical protein ACQKMY_20995 [Peribacillus frigoritolerans]|uniref:hypothetical protein n=1 Tax=Peribacillus frigoritolerans TaxID=450367 RepID=UPI0007BEE35D
MHQVRLLEGTFKPFIHFEKIKQSEKVKGLPLRIAAIIGLSIWISAVGAFLGISTEEIMKMMDIIRRDKLEFAKLYFGVGEVLSGLFFPLLIIVFFSLFFRMFFKQVGFTKLITIQLFTAFVFTIEKMLNFPIFYILGINSESSPFGLGVLIQLISEQTFLVNFISHITIFQIWAACLQIIAFRKMSDKTMKSIIGIVLFANIIFMLILTTSTILIQDLGTSL